jgi:polyferredoxin
VYYIGLALFAIGLGCFILSLGLSHYRISGDTLEALAQSGVIAGAHREVLFDELSALDGRDFATVFAFADAIEGKIGDANARLVSAPIWDYTRGQYTFWIVREAGRGLLPAHVPIFLLGSVGLAALGGLLLFLPRIGSEPAGIKNNGVQFSSVKSRGLLGIVLGVSLIGFYIALYFFPVYIVNWIRLTDPLSYALRGQPATQWFFYGTLYTIVILVMGVRMLVNYRHSAYHVVRTGSVMFFQLGFAFLIPAVLAALNRPEIDFKNAWPLDYTFFYGYRLDAYTSGGALGWFILLWGLALALLVVPLLAFFFGKRWYCSWVCGCGGLAETLGDPFRQLSDKRLKAWRIERWMVHGVLVLALVMTAIVLVNYLTGREGAPLLGELTWRVQSWYGFLIGSVFAGVVGTGFYPLMGNRVWCRFGCPLAAILGIVQKFKSRFRITTNGGQCISCGNCSTYCEMGIDVRWYAQRGQNIIRASCVGCGICAAVCPRGVLRLENGPTAGRYNTTSLLQIGDGRVG